MNDAILHPGGFGSQGSFDPATDGWTFAEEGGFVGLVGPFWSKESGTRRYGFLAEPRHANLIGIVQGGMLMTFADRGLGMLAWEAAGRPAVTASFDMQFVGAGRIGSFIDALLRCGRSVIGSAQGSWKILSERRRAAPIAPS